MLEGIGEFKSELKRNNDLLEKRISFKRMFFLGITHGLGSAIGTTIIAGILVALLLRFVQSVENVPFLNQYVQSDEIRENLHYPN